jgi:hypothetical protein
MRIGGHAGYARFTIRLRIWEAGVRTFSSELFKSSTYKGSPGWILKMLSSCCFALCVFNSVRLIPRFDTPVSSVQNIC